MRKQSSTPRLAANKLALAPAVLLLAGLASGCERPAAKKATGEARPQATPLAHLEALKPVVEVQPAGEGKDRAGAEQMALFANDTVKTRESGAVDVVFAGNNRVHLGPSAALLIEAQGGAGAELGAVVLGGAVRATAGGSGVPLRVRSPVGSARLGGANVSVLDVSIEQGIAVRLGEVGLEQPDRTGEVALSVGQVVTLATASKAEGIVVSSLAPSADLEPMTFAVRESPFARARGLRGAVEWQERGASRWRPLAAGLSVGNGDRLQVPAGGNLELDLDEHARIALAGATALELRRSVITDDEHRYAFALGGGCVQLSAERSEIPSTHLVEVAGTELAVTAGASRADVVLQQAGDRTDVLVRYGLVTLKNGQQVRAGERAQVAGGALVEAARPAFEGAVALREGRPAVVFVASQVPPIRFEARGQPGQLDEVRFGREASLSAGAFSEHLVDRGFVTHDVKRGRTWWRVGQADVAALDVIAEPVRAQSPNGRVTHIDDDGASARILYQNVLPAIQLHWASRSTAARYRIELASQKTSGTPIWSLETAAIEARVPPSVLREGRFVWRVVPLSAAGRPLGRSLENKLQVNHDNQIVGLRIDEPQSDLTTTEAKAKVRGEVEEGAELTMNGRAIALKKGRRFQETIDLTPGENHLVFRLAKPQRPDKFYLRTISRTEARPL